MTADELLRVPRGYGVRHELVAGVLKTIPAGGAAHGLAAMHLQLSIGNHVAEHGLGRVLGPCGFQLEWSPDTVLAPDVAFVTPAWWIDTWGYLPEPPDLAVEVVNFDETLADMKHRAHDWIAAGTARVIVVDPRSQTVVVVTPQGESPVDGTVTGGDVLPGWSIPVRDIFD